MDDGGVENQQGWERLGRLLAERRQELGFRKRAPFAKAKGFANDRVLFDLENAKRDNYAPATLAQVEQAYAWGVGSIAAVLAGGNPRAYNDTVIEVTHYGPKSLTFSEPGPPEADVPEWVGEAASEIDLRRLNLDELAEHWAVVDFEASRAGREYARRRRITFAEARDELYRYLRDGGLPSEDFPEADYADAAAREEAFQRMTDQFARAGYTIIRPDEQESDDARADAAAMTPAGASPAAGVQVTPQEVREAPPAGGSGPGVDVAADDLARRRRALKADQIAADVVPNAARGDEGTPEMPR